MNADDDFTSTLRSLTKREIQDAVPIHTFSSAEKRSRSKMEEAAHLLCSDHRFLLADAARLKRRRRDGLERDSIVEPDRVVRSLSDNAFFETVSEECHRKCISKFIDATCSKAVATASCAICARTFFTSDIETMLLSDLPNKNRLAPAKPHPVQVLTNGMLLHRGPNSFTSLSDQAQEVNMCH